MKSRHPASFLLALLLVAPSLSAQSFHAGGFADATLKKNDIDFGELDFYAAAHWNDAWSALGEGLVQHVAEHSDADTGHHGVEMDLERLYVSYSRSDLLRIEIGRVYTGIIDWNEREARGRFLQTPIDVPAIARRQEQGGVWPLHFAGAWAAGAIPGSAGVHYGAGIGASRGPNVEDTGSLGRSGSSAALLSLSIEPEHIAGFRAGAAILRDGIPAREGRYRELDTTLSSSYVNNGLELRSEWSRMDHRLESSGHSYVTQGWYALLSKRLNGGLQMLRPYVLVDRLAVAEGEPYLADVPTQSAWAVGTRWDAAKNLSFKLDYRSQRRAGQDRRREFRLQAGISY
jgi:hypothetical protein